MRSVSVFSIESQLEGEKKRKGRKKKKGTGTNFARLIFQWMWLLGNCKAFAMLYDVQACIVNQLGSEQPNTCTHANEATHANTQHGLLAW